MATWTASTAIPTGGLITSAWMNNVTGMVNFLGAAGGITVAKDAAFLRSATTQSITAGLWQAVNFATEDFDAADGHSNTTNPSRYTVKASGKYQLSAVVYATYTSGSDVIAGAFRKNGTGTSIIGFIPGSAIRIWPSTGTFYGLVYPTILTSLTAGDYVEVMYNNSNASPVIDGTSYGVSFSIQWVGA